MAPPPLELRWGGPLRGLEGVTVIAVWGLDKDKENSVALQVKSGVEGVAVCGFFCGGFLFVRLDNCL